MKKKLFCLICLFGFTFADETYSVLADPLMSPYSMSENWITTHYALTSVEDTTIGPFKSTNGAGVIGRMGELIFIWGPVNQLMIVTNHEIFGHGYRIRDLGIDFAKVQSYFIRAPFPYNTGGGATTFTITNQTQPEQMIDISIAGMEASSILANRLKMNWMQGRQIDGRVATLYLFSQHDTTSYVYSTRDWPGVEDGNDVGDYVKWFNILHPKGKISINQLRKNVWLNFMDPFTFYSAFAYGKYVALGESAEIYMIPFGDQVYYLPGFRYALAPYGPERYLENYLSVNGAPIYFYLKTGNADRHRSYGLGLEYPKLFIWQYFSLGGRVDLWKQRQTTTPLTFLQVINYGETNRNIPVKNKTLYGVGMYAIAEAKIPNTPVGFLLNLGFKTKGYLPGEALKESLILRFGLTAKF
ncbi:MAG: hypothetical protein MRY21_03955 [Simkaniaceae bacterium]|nr:hypothetical protein [Simkaniaceae bacterium]